jgi:hypothetical protein
VPLNTHQPQPSQTPKRPRGGIGKRRPGSRNAPEETFFIKTRFKFLIDRSLDIEENERASDIEEKTPHREVLSRANPVGRSHIEDFSTVWAKLNSVRELAAPSPKPEYCLFRTLDRRIKFPIFQVPFRVVHVRLRVGRLVVQYPPAPPLVTNRRSSADRIPWRCDPRISTHHMFSTTVAPAGMQYPWYVSFTVARFGTPIGSGHPHRITSFKIAEVYGKSTWSEKSGKRSVPTTLSNSSCALLIVRGLRAMARKKVCRIDPVCRQSGINLLTNQLNSSPYGIDRSWLREVASVSEGYTSHEIPHQGTRSPLSLELHSPRTLYLQILNRGRNTTKRWNCCHFRRTRYQVNLGVGGRDIGARLTFIEVFTYSRGSLTITSNFPRATLAKVLNPAPGNHSGTYLTGTKCKSDYMIF